MKKTRAFIHYLPIYGCIATGMIYSVIGVIAILSFLRIRDGGADESSMIAVLNDSFIGGVLIWIILLGTVSYIIWRLYEAFTDPYGYGKDLKGKAKRIGIALSTIADVLIVYAAIRVLIGTDNIQVNGEPAEERAMINSVLHHRWGNWVVVGIGVAVSLTAIVQFIYGVTRGYRERVDMDHFRRITRNTVHILAWCGYFARGIILGITGFFLLKAGLLKDARHVVNTDKAFDFIGDHVGHVYFILIAIGTICYGLFMFMLGLTYDTDKD